MIPRRDSADAVVMSLGFSNGLMETVHLLPAHRMACWGSPLLASRRLPGVGDTFVEFILTC